FSGLGPVDEDVADGCEDEGRQPPVAAGSRAPTWTAGSPAVRSAVSQPISATPTCKAAEAAARVARLWVRPRRAPPRIVAGGMVTNASMRLKPTTRPKSSLGIVRCRSVNQVTTTSIVNTPTAPQAAASAARLR